MKLSSPPFLFLTHAAALLGGCLLYSHLRPQTGSTNGGDHQTSAGVTTSAAARTPEQILKDATPALSAKEAAAARRAKNLAAAREAIRTLQVPADIGAAVEAETADWISATAGDSTYFSPRFSALLYHWLLTDPEACNQWLSASDRNRHAADFHLDAAALELLKQPEGIGILTTKIPSITGSSLGSWLADEPDLDLINRVQTNLAPEQQKGFFRTLAYRWPKERRQELIDLTLAQNQPEALAGAGVFSENNRWLLDVSRDASLPEDFRRSLTKGSFFASSFSGDSSIPLEQRLSSFRGPPDYVYGRIVLGTLSQMAKDGTADWTGLIQSGQATAQQMVDAVSQTAPELAAAAPDILKEKILQKLLFSDTSQAADLISGLPADRRAQIVLASITKPFSTETIPLPPDAFASIMAQLPADDPSLWDRRRDAWKEEITQNFDHGSDENAAAWIEALPPGPDREIALSYGAEKFQTTHPELANRLRNQVTDPRLTQPPGE